MSKRRAPEPVVIADGLTDEQRAMIDGATSDANRAILIRLFVRANDRR